VRLNKNAISLPTGQTLLIGAGQTRNQQGGTSYGFLTTLLKADRADSSNTQASAPAPPSAKIKISGKTLTITGTKYADDISLSLKNSSTLKTVINGKETLFSLKKITKIAINAGDGDDAVVLNSSIKIAAIIHGNNGNDTLVGGAGKDSLYGDAGNDALDGGLNSDVLRGGVGDDYLYGGDGTGKDTLFGDSGNDCFKAGKGSDIGVGGSGDDYIVSSSPTLAFKTTKSIETL